MIDRDGFRNITSPLTDAQLVPLAAPDVRVQICGPLADDEFRTLGQFIADYPEAMLRAYDQIGYACVGTLDILRHFPTVRRLAIDLWLLTTFEGLEHANPTLESLSLGDTKSKKPSLAPLARFTALRQLSVNAAKGIDVVSGLSHLETVSAGGTLPNLDAFAELPTLSDFRLQGGRTANLSALARFPALRKLEIVDVRSLTNLDALAELSLERLDLAWLKQVTALPPMDGALALRHVKFDTMNGFVDFDGLARAPALELLEFIAARHLQPEAFAPLLGHPTLRAIRVGFGSDRRSHALSEMFNLPSYLPEPDTSR